MIRAARRAAGVAALVLLSLVPGRARAESRELTLADAIERACARNLALMVSRADLDLADKGLGVAASAYEPTLRAGVVRSGDLPNFLDPEQPLSAVSASIGVQQALPGGGSLGLEYSFTRYDALAEELGYESFPDLALTVSQPLLQGAVLGGRERAVTEASEEVDLARLALEAAIEDLVLAVEDAYWALVDAQQAVDAAELSLQGARQQEAWVRERIELGFDAPSEALGPEERIAASEVALATAKAGRAEAEARLLYLMGEDPAAADRAALVPVSPPTEGPAPVPADTAYGAATDRNVGLRMARESLQASRRSLRYAVLDNLPSLDAFFSLRRDFGRPDLPPPWTVGLSLSMPLPGRGRILGMQASRVRLHQAELRLEDARRRLRLEVEAALRDVETGAARLTLSERGLDVAQRKYEAEVERLDRGRATSRSVLEFLEDRDQAVAARNDGLTALARARARLRRVTGTAMEAWGLDLRALLSKAAPR